MFRVYLLPEWREFGIDIRHERRPSAPPVATGPRSRAVAMRCGHALRRDRVPVCKKIA